MGLLRIAAKTAGKAAGKAAVKTAGNMKSALAKDSECDGCGKALRSAKANVCSTACAKIAATRY